MDLTTLFICMGSLFLMILVGIVCCRTGLLDHRGNKVLSGLVINVALSAKIIDSMVNTEVSLTGGEAKDLLVAIVVVYILWWLLGLAFSRLMPRDHRRLYLFMMMFGNIGFLGYPLVSALYGADKLFYVALFNVPFNILVYTYGVYLIRGTAGGHSWKSFLNAPILAVLLSGLLLLLGIRLPAPVADAVTSLGEMTVPGAMLVVGASLGHVKVRSVLREWRFFALAAASLILRPVVCWAVLRLVISDPVVLAVGVLLSAAPVAANTTALCVEYEVDEFHASAGVLITTILSMLTIPMIGTLLLL